MHAIPARRQFEQGDLLSQRTLRDRQVTQLRDFADADPWDCSDALNLDFECVPPPADDEPCSMVSSRVPILLSCESGI